MALAGTTALGRVPTATDRPAIERATSLPEPEDVRVWFATAYRDHVGDVYRYCLHRLGSREAAEDATSDIFAKALAKLDSYRERSTFRTWLFTIAHNTVIDMYRGQRPSDPIDAAADIIDSGRSPEAHAIAAASDELVHRMLAQLTPRSARVLELRLSGFSSQEIADVLSCSVDAVKQAQFRGYSRLRELIEAEGYGDVDR